MSDKLPAPGRRDEARPECSPQGPKSALSPQDRKFQVLYELAIAMTGEHSLDENLRMVVDKCRALLGADTAYIALRDTERGDVYMHTLSGVRTEAFKKMRLPFGKGLGGLVAETRQGYIIDDYFNQPELVRVVDPVVRDEGVVSGMAAPIQMGRENVGVLYAFNRRPTRFTRDDLDTLFLIGNLAAVEISRQRVQKDLKAAQADLERRVAERTTELDQSNRRLRQEIGERQRAEDALRLSEQEFRTLVNNLHVGICRTVPGPPARFLRVNPALANILGYDSVDELMRVSPSELFPVDEHRQEIIREAVEKGFVADRQTQILRKDGSLVWVSITSAAKRGGQGGLMWMDSVVEDITERRQSEQALRESEERYRHAFANITDSIFTHDLQGRLLSVNPAMANFLGKTEQELIGMSVADIMLPQHREEFFGEYLPRIQEDGYYEGVSVYVANDGHFIYAEYRNQLVRPEGGAPYVTGLARDITERMLMDKVLKQSEERFRSVVENSHDGIVIVDDSFHMAYANDQFCRLLGERREKLLGRDFRDFLNTDDLEMVIETYRERQQGGSPPARYEFRINRSDGETRWVETSSSLIKDSQGRAQTVAQLLDITDRKQAEKEKARLESQLRQAHKMEGIGTLASGVAHDFNNILQVISGYIQVMRDEADRSPEDAGRLEQVSRAVARASDLVQRLLAFGRKVEPQMASVDLNEEIREIVALLERTLPKMINIQTDLAEGLGRVRGDPSLLGQVIVNLSSNAADAMPDGGQLLIETRRQSLGRDASQRLGELPPGDYAVLRLSDNGQGIPPQDLDHIFDPFFTTKDVGRGTGLGLSMAYGIVLSHGGRIFCESSPGQGATFTIYLPILAGDREPVRAPGTMESQRGGETVLLVDDEPALVSVGSEILSSLGYRLLTASTGEQALDLYRENPGEIDLVVLDLGMPGMGGRKCLEHLRELDPQVKVIVASGYAEESLDQTLKQAGAARFMRKPYQLGEMVKNIREVLDA